MVRGQFPDPGWLAVFDQDAGLGCFFVDGIFEGAGGDKLADCHEASVVVVSQHRREDKGMADVGQDFETGLHLLRAQGEVWTRLTLQRGRGEEREGGREKREGEGNDVSIILLFLAETSLLEPRHFVIGHFVRLSRFSTKATLLLVHHHCNCCIVLEITHHTIQWTNHRSLVY